MNTTQLNAKEEITKEKMAEILDSLPFLFNRLFKEREKLSPELQQLIIKLEKYLFGYTDEELNDHY